MHGLMPDLMPGLMPDLMLILMPGGLMAKPAGATTYPAGIRGQTHGQITGTHSRSHKPREPTTHSRDLHDQTHNGNPHTESTARIHGRNPRSESTARIHPRIYMEGSIPLSLEAH